MQIAQKDNKNNARKGDTNSKWFRGISWKVCTGRVGEGEGRQGYVLMKWQQKQRQTKLQTYNSKWPRAAMCREVGSSSSSGRSSSTEGNNKGDTQLNKLCLEGEARAGGRQLDNSAGAWIISSWRPLCLRLCLDTGNRQGVRPRRGWVQAMWIRIGIGIGIGLGLGLGHGPRSRSGLGLGLRFKATASALLTKVLRVFFGFGIAKEASARKWVE